MQRITLPPLTIMLMLGTASAEKITAESQLIDAACYLGMNVSGESHKTCAAMCAKKGLPVAVLTQKDGICDK